MKSEVIAIRKTVPPYKNLIPSFDKWSIHVNAIAQKYKLILNATGSVQNTEISIACEPSKIYTFAINNGDRVIVDSVDSNNTGILRHLDLTTKGQTLISFTTHVNAVKLKIICTSTIAGMAVFENPILVKGEFGSLDFYPLEDFRIKERLKDSGSVKDVRIRFYSGVEKSLRVRPYLLHKAGRAEDFFTYPEGTEPYITGDDDQLQFPVLVDFDYDDEVVVDYENVGDYPYTLAVDIIVSYYPDEVVS